MQAQEKSWFSYLMTAFLLIILIFIATQLYKLNSQRSALSERLEENKQELSTLKTEQDKVEQEIEYFQNEANLEKELKSRFNYRKKWEEMLILINSLGQNSPQ